VGEKKNMELNREWKSEGDRVRGRQEMMGETEREREG
jgi:hypothetical protein